MSRRRIKFLAFGARAHHCCGMSKKARELEVELEMAAERVPTNLGQQKLRIWAAGRSIRQAAKDLGSNYRSYRRWAWEGALPDYSGRRLCREVAGVEYEDWEAPPSKALVKRLEKLESAETSQ